VRALAHTKPPVSAHTAIPRNQLTFRRALADERQAKLKLSVLQKHIKQLRRKGRKFEQTKTNAQASAAKSLEAYAKASCRQLCDEVYSRFPREVRDMIYGYVNTTADMRIDLNAGWGGKYSYFESVSEAQWHDSIKDPQHWWETDFVGENLRRELSEYYYRSNCFLFSDKFELLPRFRVTDQWKLGFVPADVIANVGVSISCADYDFKGLVPLSKPDRNSSAWDYDGWGGDISPRDPCSVLLSKLEQLFGFKKGTRVSMKFIVGKGKKKGTTLEVKQWLCDTVLAFTLPSIQRLASNGYVLRIILADGFACDGYIKKDDFIFESKTFDQDTIQSSFDLVSLLSREFVSITHSCSSKRSNWRTKSLRKRRTTTSKKAPKKAKRRTQTQTKTATANEHVQYHSVVFTKDSNSRMKRL
jgi:hypothetical protein